MSNEGGNIVRIPIKEDLNEALKPLETRIRQCDALRQGLILELHRYTNDPAHNPAAADSLRTYILNFEMQAIDPANAYVHAVRSGRASPERIHADTVALDTWVTDIESRYPIDWGNQVVSAVVLPFKPHAE